jgi:prephenate dehydratase
MVRRVAFQGERGAFSEEAIMQEFGSKVKAVPYQSLRLVFESVAKQETDSALVPIENSLEGGVTETYDLLIDTSLRITGEVKLRIRHCLIARPDSALSGVRQVISHPQALAQCRASLDKLGLIPQPFYDTAGAVKFVADSSDHSLAAIGSRRSAEVYGMKILRRDMEDFRTNYTRFLVLGAKPLKSVTGDGKTSLIFSTKHRSGSLFEALEPFARERINLTKIESRPTKRAPWEYYFYLDFDGSVDEESVSRAVDDLRSRVHFVKILGSYTRAK